MSKNVCGERLINGIVKENPTFDAWYVSDFGGYILGHEWSGHGIIDNGCIDFIQYADFSIA